MKKTLFKIIFSLIFVAIAVLKLFNVWFDARIDMTFLGLIIISLLPWMSGYFKSIEAFGVKAEFISDSKKEELDKEADKVIKSNEIMINKSENIEITKNFNAISNSKVSDVLNYTNNPLEKMVLIRYEIEKALRQICDIKFGDRKNFKSIKIITDELCRKNVIEKEVRNLILDLIPMLNKAVHSDLSIKEYDDVLWVIDKGMLIIAYLNTVQDSIKINTK